MMAFEICKKFVGIVGISSPADCGSRCTNFSLSRKSLSPGVASLRSVTPLRKDGRRQPISQRLSSGRSVGSVHASQEGCGFFGGLSTLRTDETLPEKPCSDQSSVFGNDTLEKWVERSVTEIVRHLPEAPFLQYVFNSDNFGGKPERQRVSEELFDKPDSWGSVRQCLLESAPDGVILVHRLDQDSLSECCMNECSNVERSSSDNSLQVGGSSTAVWGVLVQGCRLRCNACYILKTTQVASSTGVLTHFCLSRAKCFGPSIKQQMQRTWLL